MGASKRDDISRYILVALVAILVSKAVSSNVTVSDEKHNKKHNESLSGNGSSRELLLRESQDCHLQKDGYDVLC